MLFSGGLWCTVKKLQQWPSLLPLCPAQSTASCLPSCAGLSEAPVAFETLKQLQGWWQEAGDTCRAWWAPTKPLGSPFYLVPPPDCKGYRAEAQGKRLLHAGGEVMRSPVSDFWNTAVAAENSQKGLSMCIIIRKRGREPPLMREKVNRAWETGNIL